MIYFLKRENEKINNRRKRFWDKFFFDCVFITHNTSLYSLQFFSVIYLFAEYNLMHGKLLFNQLFDWS